MARAVIVADSSRHKVLTAGAYVLVLITILLGWQYAGLNLIHAETGVGYALGIIGTTMMVLLLLYPARKRARAFRYLGPVKQWFRLHMIFGILGPLLIIFHSNFKLGSLNSRVALFSTLIVASSGIVGRYLYAKLHYGLYGRSASMKSLRNDVTSFRDSESGIVKLIPTIETELCKREDAHFARESGFTMALVHAIFSGLAGRFRLWRLKSKARRLINEAATSSTVIAEHRDRLIRNTNDYLTRRVMLLRKYVEYRVFERLFALWHVVHYPLFLVMVIAATIHVFAVHAY